jgi:Tfp pilus assembly protein PilZ
VLSCVFYKFGCAASEKSSGILVHSTQLSAPLQIQKRIESLIAHVLNSDQVAMFVLLSLLAEERDHSPLLYFNGG